MLNYSSPFTYIHTLSIHSMVKLGGKLGKLKSILKSLSSVTHRMTTTKGDITKCNSTTGLYPVYVGKSRRQYMLTSKLVEHPLIQKLLKSSNNNGDIVVECEVVLFEHLLWILENGEDENELLELVEYYAC